MTTSTVFAGPMRGAEPIPGYVLEEPIGSGGYGEVWRARLPGGLFKAVKFIYGRLDDNRASQELKSLNRIKEVHHPFLISLERIEVVNNHLIVVSELAECSLRERFDHYRTQDLPGIPRTELLEYLKDAADVLDFLYSRYSFQHLDIKPENLLIVGNHVKVADFGLLRNVEATSASMVGGLTPAYSPPEVLSGKPGCYSDQYSLAIVYQEMLIGESPFGGRSAAQLVAQHLHSAPQVHRLPPSDQAVILRALSKRPEARFPNCRSMIENLAQPNRSLIRTANKTRGEAKAATAGSAATPQDLAREPFLEENAPRTIEQLPPVSPTGPAESVRPFVIIGVGGTGCQVVQRACTRIKKRIGTLRRVPCVQFVMIDANNKSLSSALNEEPELITAETIWTPLQNPTEYRGRAEEVLSWMSRRWLYNIPRSLQTEGMRPLGRLALIDKQEMVRERLTKILSAATDREALAESGQLTGLTFESGPPRVLIVSSISGGMGSGSVLDVAQMVRSILHELGHGDQASTGILLHVMPRRPQEKDLAIANTCSCLIELGHVGAKRTPSGDAFDGMPLPLTGNIFQDAYVVHLGDDPTEINVRNALEDVAEFVCQSTLGAGARYYDAMREQEHLKHGDPLEHGTIRTLGVVRLPKPRECDTARIEEFIVQLLRYWLGESKHVAKEDVYPLSLIQRAAIVIADQFGLRVEKFQEDAQQLLHARLGCSEQAYVQRVVDQMFEAQKSVAASNPLMLQVPAEIYNILDNTLHTNDPNSQMFAFAAFDELAAKFTAQCHSKMQKLREWLDHQLDVAGVRSYGAHCVAKWFFLAIESQYSMSQKGLLDCQREIASIRGQMSSKELCLSRDLLAPRLFRYGELRLQQVVQYCVSAAIHALQGDLVEILSELRSTTDALKNMHAMYLSSIDSRTHTAVKTKVIEDYPEELGDRNFAWADPQLLSEFDAEVEKQLGAGQRLSKLLLDQDGRSRFVGILQRAAQTILNKERAPTTDPDGTDSGSGPNMNLMGRISQATPLLMECGGGARLLAIGPMASEIAIKQAIGAAFETPLNFVAEQNEEIVIAWEIERIPLAQVLKTLIGNRRDFLDAARRLHTRIDVQWSFP